ncbi:DctM TRAP-type C4-dicarboxylate transport system, small permease component [Rhabdaerophilaceae bacterium]
MSEIDLDSLEVHGEAAKPDLLGQLTQGVAAFGTIMTFGLMVLIVADVVGRSFLSRPITGVAEIAAHSIVAIVFMQLASTVHARRMTRADFLIEKFHVSAPKVGRALEALFLLCGALLCGLIAFAGFKPFLGAFNANEFFGVRGVFTIPTWPFRLIIVVGAALAALVFLIQAIEEFNRKNGMVR